MVEKDYAEAMKLFAPSVPANEKNLLLLPMYLLNTVRERNVDIDTAREREAKLTEEKTATVQRETKKAEDAVAAQKKAEADLEQTRVEHAKMLAAVNQQKDEAVAKFGEYKQMLDSKMAAVTNELKNTTATADRQRAAIDDLTDKLAQYENPDFAAPQGDIIDVANGGTVVWINLGKEDGLREGVPFSVIDESAVNISEAKPKAQLIVNRVFDAHLCQATVQDYDYRKTIMKGDKVYSPAWRPGRKVGFALVGVMDVNGDGKDDINQIRELIGTAGGSIDAEISPEGTSTGQMTYNTSWLVLGTDLSLPENASDEMRQQQAAKATQYAEFMKLARQNGVQQISLDKLMGYLKTKSSDRTIPLGTRTRADDFPIGKRVNPPASRGSVSDIYTPRVAPK